MFFRLILLVLSAALQARLAAAAVTNYGCQMTLHHRDSVNPYLLNPQDTVPFSWYLAYTPASCAGVAVPMIMNVNPGTSSASTIKCGAANSSTTNTGTWTIPTTDTTTKTEVKALMFCNIARSALGTSNTYNLASMIANQNTTTTGINFKAQYVATRPIASDAPQRRRKREIEAGLAPEGFVCRKAGHIACPKVGAPKGTWECIEDNKVDNCGGCPASPDAVDCSELAGVNGVQCRVGQCDVSSCVPGYILLNKVCVPALTKGSARSASTRQRQRFNAANARRQPRQPLQPVAQRPTPVKRA